jgi:ArsR family transcriptional regulator
VKQPTVSYHLKQLVDAGLLDRERRGTYGYYRLAPGALARIAAIFALPERAGVSAAA